MQKQCTLKYTEVNDLTFTNETLSKEIMKKTRLRNKFVKDSTDYNKGK